MTPPTPTRTRTCSECKEVHPAGSKPWGCTLQVWMCRRCQHRLRQRAARQSSPVVSDTVRTRFMYLVRDRIESTGKISKPVAEALDNLDSLARAIDLCNHHGFDVVDARELDKRENQRKLAQSQAASLEQRVSLLEGMLQKAGAA